MGVKSKISITTKVRNNITFLKEDYASMPFNLVEVREDKQQSKLEMMLMSSSPGILNGDLYEFKIDIAKNGALEFKTQSYQRLFTMIDKAQQRIKVNVEENGYFQYTPHPTVPHKDAHFLSENHIYLADNSSVIWSDVTSCGRKLNNEAFEYRHFENKTVFYKDERPVVIEHILFQPERKSPLLMGQLEGFTHTASVFILSEKINLKALEEYIEAILTKEKNVAFGVSKAPINGLIIKILGQKAEHIYNLISKLAEQVYQSFIKEK